MSSTPTTDERTDTHAKRSLMFSDNEMYQEMVALSKRFERQNREMLYLLGRCRAEAVVHPELREALDSMIAKARP